MHKHDHFKYLFGDPGYMGEEMFVMQQLGKHEFASRHDLNVVHAYNNMHVRYKVQVEWGIKVLKWKWKRFMKHFDSTKPKYSHLFKIIAILTNFIYKHCLDFTFEVIGAHIS